jgi:hypothetical protein
MSLGHAWTIVAAGVVSLVVAAAPVYPDAPKKKKASPPPRTAQPWPDAEEMARRREDAESRRLFQEASPLPFTLTADFKAVGKDRKPGSTRRFPAMIATVGDDGQPRSIPISLSTRGHARLIRNCGFVPLRLELPREDMKGTPFEGHGTLKLVTHCHGSKDYEQGALREYLAYRIFNLLTPRSFRVRLARATYVDSRSGRPIATRYAMLLESERDLARRLEARVAALPRTTFRHLDRGALASMMLFEYMIGNTDFSIYVQHNVRLLQNQAGVIHPVPYDFDYAGLVNAPYALPARGLNLKTVLERAYLGPCLIPDEMPPLVAAFREKKADVMALVDSVEGMEPGTRREAKAYLEEFFSTIERPRDARRLLVDGCTKRAGM